MKKTKINVVNRVKPDSINEELGTVNYGTTVIRELTAITHDLDVEVMAKALGISYETARLIRLAVLNLKLGDVIRAQRDHFISKMED